MTLERHVQYQVRVKITAEFTGFNSWPCEAQPSLCKEPFSISGTDGDCEAGWHMGNPAI